MKEKRYLVMAGIEVVNDPAIRKRLAAGEDLWDTMEIETTRHEVGETVSDTDIPVESLGWLVEQGILVPSKSPQNTRDSYSTAEPVDNPISTEGGAV